VAGSCLVAIVAAAAACAKNRRLGEKRDGAMTKPLLEDSNDSELLELRDAAEFDMETGAPTNAAAQKLCMLQWRAGEPDSVRDLPHGDIAAATGGFSPTNRLAGGGSCTVFQGSLYGLDVAVKQLHADADEWNNAQFEAEMQLLCTVTHENICCLLAFSTDGLQRCLVLELCTGGALDTRLACKAVGGGAALPEPLAWQERLDIAVGIASALVHLHTRRPQLLHRDLKTANVLLDGAGKAKVADFGTVREGPTTQSGATHILTQRRVGTRVYM
jgi:serine/threonine protein kinase